jgi:hypothetical protein
MNIHYATVPVIVPFAPGKKVKTDEPVIELPREPAEPVEPVDPVPPEEPPPPPEPPP